MRKMLPAVSVIAALLAIVFLAGCKKENIGAKITGKWTFLQINYLKEVYGRDSTFFQGFDGGSYLQLNADRTFSAIIELSYSGTWELNGRQLTLLFPADSTSASFDVQKVNSRDLVLFSNIENDSGFVQQTWYLRK